MPKALLATPLCHVSRSPHALWSARCNTELMIAASATMIIGAKFAWAKARCSLDQGLPVQELLHRHKPRKKG